MSANPTVIKAETTKKEYAKLTGIFLFLVIAATLMGTLDGFNAHEWLRWFMGGFMILFGSFKLMGIEVFIKVFPLYDLIAKRFKPYTYVYPLLQIFLGMLYIAGLMAVPRDIITLVMAASGGIGILKIVASRGPIKLSYLGNTIKLRYSTVSLLENTIMAVGAFILLVGSFIY
jgi:hypothetical protein